MLFILLCLSGDSSNFVRDVLEGGVMDEDTVHLLLCWSLSQICFGGYGFGLLECCSRSTMKVGPTMC